MTGPKINPDSRDIVDNSDDKAHLHEFIAKKFPKVDPNPSNVEDESKTSSSFYIL